jgi:hypothetical protein
VTRENKNTWCVGLDWLTEFGAFDCSFIYEKGNKTVPIHTQVWCQWELIHLTSRLRLQYSGIIDIIVVAYNCIKVFNRLASEQYFLTLLEIQLIWISASQTELSLDSSCWRSSQRTAPRTNPASLFKNPIIGVDQGYELIVVRDEESDMSSNTWHAWYLFSLGSSKASFSVSYMLTSFEEMKVLHPSGFLPHEWQQ